MTPRHRMADKEGDVAVGAGAVTGVAVTVESHEAAVEGIARMAKGPEDILIPAPHPRLHTEQGEEEGAEAS
jgi:hypothetical protein